VELTRRGLVLGGAAAAALTAAWPLVRQAGTYPTPSWSPRVLTPRDVAVYAVVGDFLVPPGAGLPGSAGDESTLKRLDVWLAGAPEHKARLLAALPLVLEHGTALDRYGSRALTRLPPPLQEASLQAWADSRVATTAQIWAAVRMIFGFAYFERVDVAQAVRLPFLCT
jgi:hypothetical protein